MNKQIFQEYFNYESPSFSVKDLYEDKIKMTRLKKVLMNQEIPENENQEKYIVEKILNFNKQQQVKVIKILTPRQIL